MRTGIFSRMFEVAVMAVTISMLISTMVMAEKHIGLEKVNINEATVKELSAIRGIGRKKAMAIVAYREREGMFENIEGIKKVKGIGKKTFEKIKGYLSVDGG